MVHPSIIEARLSKLGVKTTRWFKAEINELQHILMDQEEIIEFVTGRYFGGFAILVATDKRLLLIDKKVFFLTLEDIRYDMISEIDFSSRLMDASLTIFTINKQHKFTSMKNKHLLRKLTSYMQQRIMEIRQYQHQPMQQQLQQHPHPQQYAQIQEPAPVAHIAAPQPETAGTMNMNPQLSHVSSMPTLEVPQLVGSAAITGANWIGFNPYTRAALVTKRTGRF